MTEEEWFAVDDARPMLTLFGNGASERKLRLFGAACCRLVWDTFLDPRSRSAIEASERLAEGQLGEQERIRTEKLAFEVAEELDDVEFEQHLPAAASLVRSPFTVDDALSCAYHTAYAALYHGGDSAFEGVEWELMTEHAACLREYFGNPFRPVAFYPAWRTSTVVALATGVYEDRAFDRLPILADTLQDAGCDADDLLNHLRDPAATHVRGCWALDLVLGKT